MRQNTHQKERRGFRLLKLFLSCSLLLATLTLNTGPSQETQRISSLIEGTYDDIHIVISTGCSGYQNWQSEVFLYSWAALKHPGRVTRIAAGCKSDEERLLANTTAVPNGDHRIQFYFVKDYTPTDEMEGVDANDHPFVYFNKPYGFNEWLMDADNHIYENVIALVDPDFILLKPLAVHTQESADLMASQLAETSTEHNHRKRDLWVRRGHPVSQKYGIGAKWIDWTGFCDDRASCNLTDREAWSFYSVGPPYILHKDDWLRVAPKWVEFSPLALKWEPQPSILAEMYSFTIATAYFDLKHEYLLSMVSAADSSVYMESWNDLNWDWTMDEAKDIHAEHYRLHIVHYCQGYWIGRNRATGTVRLGGWNYHKGHIPTDILYNCEVPLLAELDDYGLNMTEFRARDKTQDDRQVWVLYHVYKFINEAVANYKMKYCPQWTPQYTLVLQQPESDPSGNRMNYVLGNHSNGISYSGRGQ